MKGKDFKEKINELIKDEDTIAIIDKYNGSDCLYALAEEDIQVLNQGEDNRIVVFSRSNLQLQK